MKKSVWCYLQIDGIHSWDNIPTSQVLEDVQFLKYPHRHMFGFKCYEYVTHNDRDTEFIHRKRDVLDFLQNKYYDSKQRCFVFGSRSCEMLAEELLERFDFYKVEVSEDNENGGIIER